LEKKEKEQYREGKELGARERTQVKVGEKKVVKKCRRGESGTVF